MGLRHSLGEHHLRTVRQKDVNPIILQLQMDRFVGEVSTFSAPLKEHVAVIQCFGFACGEIVQVHLQVQLRLLGMSKYWNKCNFDGRSAKIQFTLKGVYQLNGFGVI